MKAEHIEYIMPYLYNSLPHEIFSNIPPDQPQINLHELIEANHIGPLEVQKIKQIHLDQLIAFRLNNGIGPNMKTRAQYLLQRIPEDETLRILGDPSTWMLDPKDTESAVNVADYLINTAERTELWLGFALNDDFVDAIGDKSKTPPLIRGIKSPDHLKQLLQLIRAEINIDDVDPDLVHANTRSNTEGNTISQLEEIHGYIHKIRIEKMAKRIAMIKHQDFSSLPHQTKQNLLSFYRGGASLYYSKIVSGEKSWEDFNSIYTPTNSHPMSEHNHFLVKLFAQDDPRWKIGDILLTKDELTIEIASGQYTPRDSAIKDSRKPSKITLKVIEGKLFAFTRFESDSLWLLPLTNDQGFWESFDRLILPRLRNSNYQQLQYMMKFNTPTSDISQDTMAQELAEAEIAFITDIVSGLHQINPLSREGDLNGYSMSEYFDYARDNLQMVTLPEEALTIAPFPGRVINAAYKAYEELRQGKDIEPWRLTMFSILLQKHCEDVGINLPPSAYRVFRELDQGKKPKDIAYTRILLILDSYKKI